MKRLRTLVLAGLLGSLALLAAPAQAAKTVDPNFHASVTQRP